VNRTRHTTRTVVVVATAVTSFGVVAPMQSAAAQPKPDGSRAVAHRDHSPTGCRADKLRALTVKYRAAGMSGQASHIAAQLTLGC
jgi:hypothetical protein